MNDRIDLHEHRLARELRAAAQHVELSPGNELAVVAHGRRRQVRRRRATGFVLVATIGGGTALGVQQLARTGDSGIAIDEPATASTSPTSTPDASVPTSEVPVTAGAASSAEAAYVPAVEVESNLEWTVVEPDSASAVAYLQISGEVQTVPTIGLATAPGRSDDYAPMFWRTDDGITWEPVGLEPPVGSPANAVFDGSTVYTVGTAPGIAATDSNPLVFASSPDLGATWDQIELPVDTNVGRDLPFVSSVGAGASATPIGAGTLVTVNRWIGLDYEQLAVAADEPRLASGVYAETQTGVFVADDPTCGGAGVNGELVELVELPQAVATTIAFGTEGGPCDMVEVTWAEMGLPAETIAAKSDPSAWAFVVADGVVTEVVLPDGVFFNGLIGERVTFSDVEGAMYELADDLTIVPAADLPGALGSDVTRDPAASQYVIGERDGVAFSASQLSTPYGGWAELYGASTGGAVAWADWSQLYGPDQIVNRQTRNITGAGLTTVAAVYTDPMAGGVEVSEGGITVRRSSMLLDPEFSLTDTGEVVDVSRVRIDQMTSDVVIVDGDGAELARMSGEIASPVVFGGYGIENTAPAMRWYVETSADGVHVASESIADLLGVNDEDISSVPRVSTDGTNVVVAVTMQQRNADGVPEQLVLVGTPID